MEQAGPLSKEGAPAFLFHHLIDLCIPFFIL